MPHKLHERALRLHIADSRALTLDDNPWTGREDAFLIAPLLVKATHALADVLEYLVDTRPPELAYDAYRRLLHQVEATTPAPLLHSRVCGCSAHDPVESAGGSTSPAVRYYDEKVRARANRDATYELPTEPIAVIA